VRARARRCGERQRHSGGPEYAAAPLAPWPWRTVCTEPARARTPATIGVAHGCASARGTRRRKCGVARALTRSPAVLQQQRAVVAGTLREREDRQRTMREPGTTIDLSLARATVAVSAAAADDASSPTPTRRTESCRRAACPSSPPGRFVTSPDLAVAAAGVLAVCADRMSQGPAPLSDRVTQASPVNVRRQRHVKVASALRTRVVISCSSVRRRAVSCVETAAPGSPCQPRSLRVAFASSVRPAPLSVINERDSRARAAARSCEAHGEQTLVTALVRERRCLGGARVEAAEMREIDRASAFGRRPDDLLLDVGLNLAWLETRRMEVPQQIRATGIAFALPPRSRSADNRSSLGQWRWCMRTLASRRTAPTSRGSR
jgi:hypothetical protein